MVVQIWEPRTIVSFEPPGPSGGGQLPATAHRLEPTQEIRDLAIWPTAWSSSGPTISR